MIARLKTILVVDDDIRNRKLLEVLLHSEGYLTERATSGAEALAAVALHAPDLILLDAMMPGMDGYEVTRKLKADAATANIPIIMVTSHTDRGARLAGLDAGAEDFLTKPVDRAELWLRVRNLLRSKALGDFYQSHNSSLEQEVKTRSAALLSSLKEKEALLEEVHHRVKNNMQVIASLLRLEANRIDDPATRTVLKGMQNRIQAMALLHDAVYRSNNFSSVDLGEYLNQLTKYLGRSLTDEDRVKFRLDLSSVGLDLDQAIPCGLIVNELVSNALRHAFPAGGTGEIRVELRSLPDKRLQLRVSDDGIGLPGDFEIRRTRSLGLQLASDLARQIQGELKIGPGPAAVFEVTFSPACAPAAVEIPPFAGG